MSSCFDFERALQGSRFQGLHPGSQAGLQSLLDLVSALSNRRAQLLGDLRQLAEGLHQGRAAPQVSHPPLSQGFFRLDRLQLAQRRGLDLVKNFKLAGRFGHKNLHYFLNDE